MRESKFRAWDVKNKRFLIPDKSGWNFVVDENGHVLRPFLREGGGLSMQNVTELVVLEQNTGLKDYKGNEIYEGDIVMAFNYPFWHIDRRRKLVRVVVSLPYEIQPFCGDSSDFLHEAEHWSVIGNIHQDVELFKKYEIT